MLCDFVPMFRTYVGLKRMFTVEGLRAVGAGRTDIMCAMFGSHMIEP